MARLSRLLSAVSLGIAATAAVAAVAVATEYAPVHRAPTHRVESGAEGRVIVKFKQSSDSRATIASARGETVAATGPQRAAALGARVGVSLADGRILDEHTQVIKGQGMRSAALARALAADADVEWAVVDEKRYVQILFPPVNDPLYPDNLSAGTAPSGPASGQWYLHAPGVDASGRNVVSGINIEPAWAITHGSSSIVIGDVDTGITAHPDLDSKVLPGYDFINTPEISNDGDGRDGNPTDAGDSVSAAENSDKNGTFFGCNDDGKGDPVFEPSTWHGTQTGGILGAATNNATGMAGTGFDTRIVPARALGKCGGYDSDIIAAAKWSGGIAVSGVPTNLNPARVVNMSLGGAGACSQPYVDALTALRDKGVVVVVAAGNDAGLPLGTPANCRPSTSSADQSTPVVVAVAALRHAGTKVGFSNIGTQTTISAPGGNCINTGQSEPCLYPIVTTSNSGSTSAGSPIYSNGLDHISLGTSFATPMVAGTVALMLSANPALTNREVVRLLQKTARPFPTVSDTSPQPPVCHAPSANDEQDECICTTSTCGAGMLDAGAAVTAAHALIGATAPTAAIGSTSATVQVGSSVTVTGSGTNGSTAGALTYEWLVLNGATNVTLSNAASTTVTVTGASAGSVTLQLRVIDDNGVSSVATIPVTVTPAPSSGGGGGGGAANPAWLAALALAGVLLRSRGRSRA